MTGIAEGAPGQDVKGDEGGSPEDEDVSRM